MSWTAWERLILVDLGSRAVLLLIAAGNADKAAWALAQFSGPDAWLTAWALAAALEVALIGFFFRLTAALTYNAQRRKTDPERRTGGLWTAVAAFGSVSAACNAYYFTCHGLERHALGGAPWAIVAGVLLGAAAPLLAGAVAYVTGQEAADEAAIRAAAAERERLNAERRAERERRKAEQQAERERTVTPVRSAKTNGPNGKYDAPAQALLAERPELGVRELSRLLGCSTSTASGLKQKFVIQGGNGHGESIRTEQSN